MSKAWWGLVGWRIWLFIVVFLTIQIVPFRTAFEFTSLRWLNLTVTTQVPEWVWVSANFDGIHFLRNAAESLVLEPRFLPVVPVLIKAASFSWTVQTVSSWQLLAGLVITNGAFSVALVGLYQLLKQDFPPAVTRWALALLIAFPTSFFLVSLYSESIFLALAVGALWAARRRLWLLSSLAVALASLTRLPGILLIIPVAWEWRQAYRLYRWEWESLRWVGYGVIIGLPLILYALVNQAHFGDPLYFVHDHSSLANGRSSGELVFPFITLVRYIKILTSVSPAVYEWWIAVLELAAAVWAVVAVWLSWRQRLRPSYQLYSLALLALPFLSGTFTGLPRYVCLIFPFFILLAQGPGWLKKSLLVLFLVLQAVLLALFSRGYFVA